MWILTVVNVLDHEALRHSPSLLLKSDHSLNFNNYIYFLLTPFHDNLQDDPLCWGLMHPLPIIKLLWKGRFLSGHIACPKEWPWPSSRMSLQIHFSLQRTIYEAFLLQQLSLISRNRSLRGQPSGNHPLGEKETIWLVLVQFQLLPSYIYDPGKQVTELQFPHLSNKAVRWGLLSLALQF